MLLVGCELCVMLNGDGWYNCGAPGKHCCEGGWPYPCGGWYWLLCFQIWLPLQVACSQQLSGYSELSSPRCREPNRPPGGAKLTVFGGDPFVNMLCYTNIVVNYYRCDMRYRINRSLVDFIAGSSDLQQNKGLLISHSVVTNCGDSLHLWSMKSTRALRKRILHHTYPVFLYYMLEFIY